MQEEDFARSHPGYVPSGVAQKAAVGGSNVSNGNVGNVNAVGTNGVVSVVGNAQNGFLPVNVNGNTIGSDGRMVNDGYFGGRIVGKFDTPAVGASPNGIPAYGVRENAAGVPVVRHPSGEAAVGVGTGTSQPYVSQQTENVAAVTSYPNGMAYGNQPLVRRPDGSIANTDDMSPMYDNTPQGGGQLTLSDVLGKMGDGDAKKRFQKDETKKDGGFFGWLSGLIPKNRVGQRAGETDDEYDRRMTSNRQKYFALADALRHIGNIINTTKYAPVQQFNDPVGLLEQGYQARKAERKQQEAMDADRAYKKANLSLQEKNAGMLNEYRAMNAALRQQSAALAEERFRDSVDRANRAYARQLERDGVNDDHWNKSFAEKQKQNSISNSLQQQRINKQGSGGRGGSSGSSAKYYFFDKDGNIRTQQNKTMYEQEFYREYGYSPYGSSESVSTKTIDPKTGAETTTTKRSKGESFTAAAAAAQNKAKAAREAKAKQKNTAKSSKTKTAKSKNGYKNTEALGL